MITTNISIENLKSALLELAQADRAFIVAFLKDLISENANKQPISKRARKKPLDDNGKRTLPKINPPYRQNPEALRAKYAMDKSVLLELHDLFQDAPTAETFMQAPSNA